VVWAGHLMPFEPPHDILNLILFGVLPLVILGVMSLVFRLHLTAVMDRLSAPRPDEDGADEPADA